MATWLTIAASTAKKPIVLVVHEWWGLTDYPRMRAQQLAQLGYLAMAVDMYGNGNIADNPASRPTSCHTVLPKPATGQRRLEAALMQAKDAPHGRHL